MNFHIRVANVSDSKAIWELNCTEMGYNYPLDDTIQRINAILSSKKDRIFVAVCDDSVIGYIHACCYDLIYSPHLKNIMGIAVYHKYKRQGIGRALLEKVEQWAMQEGAVGVRIVTGATRIGAHQFYHKCGYSQDRQQINLKKMF